MATEIKVPALGESVSEATIARWFKQPGEAVKADEPLVELETDKVTIEVPAPAAGVLADIAAKDGETVAVGALLGQIKEGAGAPAAAKPAAAPAAKPVEAPKAAVPAAPSGDKPVAPSVLRIASETGIDPATVPGTGKDGRVVKGDMLAAIELPSARVQLGISGRPSSYRIDLTSNPTMSEAEIISLLALGVTKDELSRFRSIDRSNVDRSEAASLVLHSTDFNRDLEKKTGLQLQIDEAVRNNPELSTRFRQGDAAVYTLQPARVLAGNAPRAMAGMKRAITTMMAP